MPLLSLRLILTPINPCTSRTSQLTETNGDGAAICVRNSIRHLVANLGPSTLEALGIHARTELFRLASPQIETFSPSHPSSTLPLPPSSRGF